MLQYPILLVFPVAMVFAAAFDLLTMTIPNRISLALVASFVLVAPFSDLPWLTLGIHVATGIAVLLFGFILFSRNWLGGGDAKLLAASGLWLGFDSLGEFMVGVALFGGLLSASILAFRVYLPVNFVPPFYWLERLHGKGNGVPYGIAIAAAALFVYPQTRWFASILGS
jgi:prepilin peptidase CpaA